ncbi:MAG: hypothetical protein L3J96_01465 [Thermoplasmata archaeon]|nr:hypothetical protein [Thermoplasmata archaeon]
MGRRLALVVLSIFLLTLTGPVGIGSMGNGTLALPVALTAGPSTGHAAQVAGASARPALPMIVSGGQGRLLVNTTDALTVPNDGLRVNITAFPFQNRPSDSSFQVAGEEGIGEFEAVFGIFQNTHTQPTAFFSIFTNNTDQNVRLGEWTAFPLIPEESYDFMLVHGNGTNWSLTVNGQLFGGNASAGTFDFAAPVATWLLSIGFSEVAIYSSQSTTPPLVSVPLAIAVHRGTAWYMPSLAQASYVGSGSAQWGVQGRVQRPTLAPGELETGSTVANVTNGTTLWTGGVVPVRVGITFASPTAVATSASEMYVTVHDTSGAAVPGVSVYLHDVLNGTFNPPTVGTNGTGGAQSLFETPNVTRTADDLVSATVTLFGYSGTAGLALSLTPPLQVFISATPASPNVSPGGSVVVTFSASNASGVPLAGVLISISVNGSAGVTPSFGVTDPSGALAITVLAPSESSPVTLTAIVDGVGQWGHVVVPVLVRSPARPLWVVYGPQIAWGVVGLMAVVVGMLLWLRRRRRQRSLPSMPLRRIIREMRRPLPGGPPPPGSDGTSRTRP